MPPIISKAGEALALTAEEKRDLLKQALEHIGKKLDRVLIIPPDITRLNSNAGELTAILYDILTPETEVDVIPALGTHNPMTSEEIRLMFGPDIPIERFKVHNWRNDIATSSIAATFRANCSGNGLKERSITPCASRSTRYSSTDTTLSYQSAR